MSSFVKFSSKLEIKDVHFIPISALNGDNVVDRSNNMQWYEGSTLMHLLENIHIGPVNASLEASNLSISLYNLHLEACSLLSTVSFFFIS